MIIESPSGQVPRKATSGRRLRIILSGIFLLALVMGPGPGALLVAGAAEAPRFMAGVPWYYVWLLGWWMIMAGCILIASLTVWRDD